MALYCQAGDIAGATTILHHMKNKDMAINESVLLSLLSAHCANNDQDSVSSTLDVITSSGINLGVDIFTTMAVSYARSGNWEKVQKTLEDAESEDISFDDSDIFSIIKACTHGGLLEESFSLISMFPKKRGFFQELRIAVPQLALGGNIPVVMELSLTQKDRPGFDKTNQGAFLAYSITRSGAPVDQIVPALLKLERFGYLLSFQNMFHEAAYHFSSEKCEQFREEVEKIKGDEKPIMNLEHTFKYLRYRLEQNDDVDRMLRCIHNLTVMKVPVPFDFLSYDIMPAMLNKTYFKPRETVIDIARALPNLSYSMMCNCMLQSLLNQQTQQHFNAAVGFFLYSNIVQVLPFKWNSSLARAFLQTRDVENMTTILYCAIKKVNNTDKKDPDLSYNQMFNSVVHIAKQAHLIQPGVPSDELIAPILEDLIKQKIGFPGHVDSHNSLLDHLKTDQAKDLLSEATRVWEDRDNYWSKKNDDIFHQKRTSLFANKMRKSQTSKVVINITEEELNDPESVEKIFDQMKNDGEIAFKISDRLIQQYIKEDQMDKADKVLRLSRQNGRPFALSPTTLDAMVDGYLKQDRLEDAKDVIFSELSLAYNRKVKCSTLMKWLAAVARTDDHAEVMETLERLDPSRVLEKEGKHVNLLQNVYVERKDVEKLQELTDFLIGNKFADLTILGPLVEIYLEKNDTAGALAEFTRLANVHRKLPKKFMLTCRLIEQGDEEGIKKVSKLASKYSIQPIKAVYDLAHCYLHMGKKSEAKLVFDDPRLAYDEDTIDYIYRQLEVHNREACQDLVDVTRNLYGCDRDHLFQKLVKTYRNDPDKVEDIWLLVQEDGIVPSDDLKIAIGSALESHGRPVPFLKPERTAKDELKPAWADSDVYNAIKDNDNIAALNIVLDRYRERTTSMKCKKYLLEHLINQSDLTRASVLATRIAHNVKNPEKNIDFRHLYYSLMSVLGEKESRTFLSSLPKKMALMLQEKQKPLKNSNEMALDALQTNDTETLSRLVSEGKVSRTMLRRILSVLLEDNRLEEAAEIAIIVGKGEDVRNIDQIVLQIRMLMTRWEDSGEVEKIKQFVTNLDPKCSYKVRGDVILRNAMIKFDPDSYLELLKEGQKYIVSHDILEESLSNHSGFLGKIVASAESGNVLANVLLAKHNLSLVEKEKFSKFYRRCPSDLSPVKLFDQIDTEEKFSLSLSEASGNKAHLEQIVNNYLRKQLKDPEDFTRIANVAVDKGMELDGFAKSFLEKLSKSKDFTLQREARAAVV